MNKFQKLVWRVRYSVYGNRKTSWGLRLWWEWSEVALFEQLEMESIVEHPHEAANEEIYAACS